MSYVELFIRPTDKDITYEMNGNAASSAFLRLYKLSKSVEFEGELSFGSAGLAGVSANIVEVMVDGLGGAHSSAGKDLDEFELRAAIQGSDCHDIDYYDI